MRAGPVRIGIYHSLPVMMMLIWLTACIAFAVEVSGDPENPGDGSASNEDRWEFKAGGQVRIRGDLAGNQNFTDFAFTPGEREGQFLERTRIHGYVENPAMGFKAFVQGQWYGRWGGKDRRSEVDLYQGYVEWENLLGFPMNLKVGRQEFSYGSTFFLGANDFYNGFSWDGFKLSTSLIEDFTADLIGARMAKLNPGDPKIYLAGLYSSYKIYEEGALDGYLFYNKGGFPFLHREFEITDSGQKWFTIGSRFAGKVGGFDYEIEPQIQWGKVKGTMGDRNDKVRAYGGHLDMGNTFKLPWEPRLFAAYAFGSGDNDPFDGRVNQFHGNIFNDSYLVGDMSVVTDLSGVTVDGVHASGMKVWAGGISVNPLSGLNLNLDIHRFRANKAPRGFSKELGYEINLAGSYKLTKSISFLAGLSRFFTGHFFDQASGSKRNIDYGYIQTQIDF